MSPLSYASVIAATANGGRLSAEQCRRFAEDGYLIVDDVFDPADLLPLQREFEANMDAKIAHLIDEGKLTESYSGASFAHRAALIHRDSPANGDAVVGELAGRDSGKYIGREMFNLLTHPKLLLTLESILGPEIVASSVYRIRPRFPGPGIGWHQDSSFWNPLCDPELVITCWIPLVDATAENGCMRIHPGVHRHGPIRHDVPTAGSGGYGPVLRDLDLPVTEPVVAAVRVGGAVFMTSHTLHCAPENHSQGVRWSVDLRYQSAASPNNAQLMPGGPDPAAAFERACFPPEADFIVHSRLDPARAVGHQQFISRREAFAAARNLSYPERWKVA